MGWRKAAPVAALRQLDVLAGGGGGGLKMQAENARGIYHHV
jgi:hypothetical protein